MSLPFWQHLLRPLSVPASWLYGAGVAMRNLSYDQDKRVERLPSPVVSVGNLTIGGSGKTPLVAHISRYLSVLDHPVAVLSRGYGRLDENEIVLVSNGDTVLVDATKGGDEPVELARDLPGLIVAVGANRHSTGMRVIKNLGRQIFVLDDGFQHRQLARDLDIVCISTYDRPDDARLFPAGRLREPYTALRRASAVVLTGSGNSQTAAGIRETVVRYAPEVPVFVARSSISGVSLLKGPMQPIALGELRGEPLGVLCGIARPECFYHDLELAELDILWSVERADHHQWEPEEVRALVDSARRRGVKAIVTTGKDGVKLERALPADLPIYRTHTQMEFDDANGFCRLLDSVAETLDTFRRIQS